MANVLLTQQCVRSCPYCFAKKYMEGSPDNDMLAWEDLIYIADLFEISHEHHMSLLGGEPTLHPEFVNFILYLIERNFKLTVFTSGIMSPKKLEEAEKYLVPVDDKKLSFVCNVNSPGISTKKEIERVSEFLKIFHSKSVLSFNIYNIDFDMNFLFEYIKKFDLKRNIRLGLAHPIPGVANEYISAENFDTLMERLASFLPHFESKKIAAGFDCGFPSCKFPDEILGRFVRLSKSDSHFIKFVCNPIVDIGPDMTVWSCFPLSNINRKSIYDFNSLLEIRDHYLKLHNTVREIETGIYDECRTCPHLETKQCSGGCIAHIISKKEDVQNKIKELYS